MLRKIDIKELKKIYKEHIKKDFPPIERPPCFIIKKNMKNKTQEGFVYIDGDKELGYAINSLSENAILISLFAVFDGERGKGIGTRFIKEIVKHYDSKRAIIVEVEKPEYAKTNEEKMLREKRISFYNKVGFDIYKDIAYSIFGVPMYLMAYSKENLTNEEITQYIKIIYGLTLRKRFQNMLKIEQI